MNVDVFYMFNFQGTLLNLLYDVVDSCKRQGKCLVVCDFPRDLRWAEEYEAKVTVQPNTNLYIFIFKDTHCEQ